MDCFRRLPDYFITQSEELCSNLMLGLDPKFDLGNIKDDLTNAQLGYSFIEHPSNGLRKAYLDLIEEACKPGRLFDRYTWNWAAISSYRKKVTKLQEMMLGGFYTACGQVPRAEDLLALDYENGPFTKCGIYIWNGYMIYIMRTHKAKRRTNREFYVVRFLPARLGRIAYLYFGWIRRFAALLRREQLGNLETERKDSAQSYYLFSTDGQPWKSNRLTSILKKATISVWGHSINIQLYRQITIGITEKHVRELCIPFNQYDDRGAEADMNVVFAWQSGHRPLQRGITYGLDGAYSSPLQPSLLRAYERASSRWHEFLHLSSKIVSPLSPEPTEVAKQLSHKTRKRKIDNLSSPMQDQATKRASTQNRQLSRNIENQDPVNPSQLRSTSHAHDQSFPTSLNEEEDIICILPEHQILLCLICKAAIQPGKGITSHLLKVHSMKGEILRKVIRHCSTLPLQDPTIIPLPSNRSKRIPQLPIYNGFECKHCTYLTINKKNIIHHCSQQGHNSGGETDKRGWDNVVLQTFTKGKYSRYWIIDID